MNSCPGFFNEKNTDLLPLHDKYKRKDCVNDSLNIIRNYGKWSIHSINCIGEQVNNRKSLHPDKRGLNKYFNFSSIDKVHFRISRMNHILTIENYLMERKSSHSGYF